MRDAQTHRREAPLRARPPERMHGGERVHEICLRMQKRYIREHVTSARGKNAELSEHYGDDADAKRRLCRPPQQQCARHAIVLRC